MLAIDISSTAVKLLELRQQGSDYRVESYAVAPLLAGSTVESDIKDIEAVGEAVKLVVARAHTTCRDAIVSVPNSLVISKVIPMDVMSESDMEAQVQLEASRFIPYPMEEVSLDFQVLSTNTEKNKSNVLVAASRLMNVNARVDALRIGGLKTTIVDVETYAVERACSLIKDSLPNSGKDKTVVVIDIGSVMTNITVLHDMETIYTREEVFGGRQLTETIQRRYNLTFEEANLAKKQGNLAEDYEPEVLDPFREALIPLIRRSLQFFFSASKYTEVDHIILAGGSALIPELTELVTERLGMSCTVANPLVNMMISSNVDSSLLNADASALMVCCGLALRSFH